jgi:hypothetical protein
MERLELQLWKDQILAAQSVRDVLALANEFMQAMPVDEIGMLPEACAPRVLRTPEDLAGYAYDLNALQVRTGSREERAQRQLWEVLTTAVHKSAALASEARYHRYFPQAARS